MLLVVQVHFLSDGLAVAASTEISICTCLPGYSSSKHQDRSYHDLVDEIMDEIRKTSKRKLCTQVMFQFGGSERIG